MYPIYIDLHLTNHVDEVCAEHGLIEAEAIRTTTIEKVLVDADVNFLSIPESLLLPLGLERAEIVEVVTEDGILHLKKYQDIKVRLQEHSTTLFCFAVPDSMPPKIGRVALMALGWGIDEENQQLKPLQFRASTRYFYE